MRSKLLSTESSPERTAVVQELSRVDWNFPRTGTHGLSVHNVHWFPGNFIPQIPAFLVQILSRPGQTVCDPFAGSGTTGVEAGILRRNSVLLDANSAAVMIAQAKLALARDARLAGCLTEFGRRVTWCGNTAVEPRERGVLERWLHSTTLAQLESVAALIAQERDAATRRVLDAVFSDTLFACSASRNAKTRTGRARRHHWGWVADNVLPAAPYAHDAVSLFLNRLGDAVDIAATTPRIYGHHQVIRSDAQRIPLRENSVDLVVTSPPYLGMIDYARANRLTFAWFDWDLSGEMQNEIGARFKRGRRTVEGQYVESMSLASAEVSRILRPGGYCAIVIGSSRRFPGASDVVLDLFGRSLSNVWGPVARVPTRRRVSERFGTEPVEFICVFRKEQ